MGPGPIPGLARITLGEWVERWWPTTADLRPGTRTLCRYRLRRFLLPAFEGTALGRVDAMASGWSERPRCAMCRSAASRPGRPGPAPEPDALVFPSGRGTYLQRSNLSRLVWRPAVQQLGLEGLRFHDLRHTAATLAAAAGGAVAAALDGLARDAEKNVWRRPRHVEGTTPRAGEREKAAGS